MEELCEGKKKYSKHEAEVMKARVGRQKDKSMRVYECDICYSFHLTKRDPRM